MNYPYLFRYSASGATGSRRETYITKRAQLSAGYFSSCHGSAGRTSSWLSQRCNNKHLGRVSVWWDKESRPFSQATMCILEQSRDIGPWGQINHRTYQCLAAFLALLLAHPTCGAPAKAADPNENSPEPSPIPVNAVETNNQRSPRLRDNRSTSRSFGSGVRIIFPAVSSRRRSIHFLGRAARRVTSSRRAPLWKKLIRTRATRLFRCRCRNKPRPAGSWCCK